MLRSAAFVLSLLVSPILCAADKPLALVIHGGAGTMSREALTPEREAEIRADLDRALDAGHAVLRAGGSALDAVTAAVVVLEDSPHFNAGKGAVFNAEGVNELDAAIMDGATQRAGAVAAIHRTKNPIRLARAVMEQSRHVMLIGEGAEKFGESVGIEFVDPAYFRTEHRWQQLQDAKAREAAQAALPRGYHYGTVGAVALDGEGRIATATSTGGTTNKRWGRVGDTPVIGAGTYAGARCGVSATGTGEFFIRLMVAYDICARMEYRGDSLAAAAEEVVMKRLPAIGGDGGIIALDGEGNISATFNTSGMYRGWIKPDGTRGTAIFKE
ncbi:isoaspartyl peptidase/L-asparaginase family protein [Rehaibacterium terrae]|jgi:beta-aspartyl-peptidase (threonine type)|uniref:Isoaspartyl peptidase n=1 Tax=Rehaibacterium terrae TaxID=1341696 RepID=A0A7W7Y1Q7_9GAMM|nr:isoaspartyl peptidase/L-asparaginase [Rehaibacterium terrae]MBB5016493.1 beta-aspartyl-peptidase (threonine type) [Rehaibacterium terrae]